MAERYKPDPYFLGRIRGTGMWAAYDARHGRHLGVRKSLGDGRVLLNALEGAYGKNHPKVKEARKALRAGSRVAVRTMRRQERGGHLTSASHAANRRASSRNAASKKDSSSYAGG